MYNKNRYRGNDMAGKELPYSLYNFIRPAIRMGNPVSFLTSVNRKNRGFHFFAFGSRIYQILYHSFICKFQKILLILYEQSTQIFMAS